MLGNLREFLFFTFFIRVICDAELLLSIELLLLDSFADSTDIAACDLRVNSLFLNLFFLLFVGCTAKLVEPVV